MPFVSIFDVVAILVAGVGAGTINAIVGSGTLITFPTLIALGYPPVVANVSNAVGSIPGSVTAVAGYRRELRGQQDRVSKLGLFAVSGGLTGAIALLVLPSSAFDAIVPVLIAIAVILVVFQTRIISRLSDRRGEANTGHPMVRALVFTTGVYGGYFGAAQGVLLLAILGIAIPDSLQRLNALKNVLIGSVLIVASVVFMFVAEVDWEVVGLLALSSTLGGWLGGNYGRLLPDRILRVVIVVVGTIAFFHLLS